MAKLTITTVLRTYAIESIVKTRLSKSVLVSCPSRDTKYLIVHLSSRLTITTTVEASAESERVEAEATLDVSLSSRLFLARA